MNHCYFLKFVWQFFILYDLFLSFVFCLWSLPLFISFSLSCLHISDTHSIPLLTLWIYSAFYTSNKKLFLTLPFFFLSLVPIIAQLLVNKEQTIKHYTNIFSNLYKLFSLSLSLSLSLSHIRERVTKPKSQKKKKKHHKHRFNS